MLARANDFPKSPEPIKEGIVSVGVPGPPESPADDAPDDERERSMSYAPGKVFDGNPYLPVLTSKRRSTIPNPTSDSSPFSPMRVEDGAVFARWCLAWTLEIALLVLYALEPRRRGGCCSALLVNEFVVETPKLDVASLLTSPEDGDEGSKPSTIPEVESVRRALKKRNLDANSEIRWVLLEDVGNGGTGSGVGGVDVG